MAALGLVMSATSILTAPAAGANGNTVITALPYTISGPGTYILKSNLSYPATSTKIPPAITVAPVAAGAVILDLKGFTLNGPGLFGSDSLIAITGDGSTAHPVTIQNGTLIGGAIGINVSSTYGVLIKNVTLGTAVNGIDFSGVGNSAVNGCKFVGPYIDGGDGIIDRNSSGGNSYNNDTFSAIEQPVSFINDFNGNVTLSLQPTVVKALATNP